MLNHLLSGSTGLIMSWEGYTYTLPSNTRAVGSALNWSLMTGFWALAAVIRQKTANAEAISLIFIINSI